MMTRTAHPASLAEPDEGHPSEYALLLYLDPEPEPGRAAVLEAHLASCAACRARCDCLEAEREAFGQQPRFAEVLDRLAAPAASIALPRRMIRWRILWACAAAAALVALAALLLRGFAPDRDAGFRLKGSEILWVVERAGRQLVAGERFAFRPGDRLGFAVEPARTAYASVLALDETGEARVILPAAGEEPLRVAAGTRTTLPASLALEPPLARSRVFVVLTEEALPPEELKHAAAAELERLRAAGQDLAALTHLPVAGRIESRWIE